MPSSKKPKKPSDATATDATPTGLPPAKTSPTWWAPVMVAFMVIGLLWIVVYYLTDYTFPVRAWGNWNLGAGFGLMMVGFLMTTNWR